MLQAGQLYPAFFVISVCKNSTIEKLVPVTTHT